MKWEYIGTGIGLIGIGITLMVALPPPWWINMPYTLIQAGLFLGLFLSIFGVCILVIGIRPTYIKMMPVVLMLVGVCVFITGAIFYKWPPSQYLFSSAEREKLADKCEHLSQEISAYYIERRDGAPHVSVNPSQSSSLEQFKMELQIQSKAYMDYSEVTRNRFTDKFSSRLAEINNDLKRQGYRPSGMWFVNGGTDIRMQQIADHLHIYAERIKNGETIEEPIGAP